MTPPAVSAPPRAAAKDAGAPAPAAGLRARAPFSRPRPSRPSLLDPRTLGVSLGVHLLAAALVLLAPPRERTPPPPPPPAETASYLDVSDWGEMATDPAAAPAPAASEAVPAFGAASADSALLRVRQPAGGGGPAFPERVPAGVAPSPGAAGGAGAPFPGAAPSGGAPSGGGAGRARSGPGGLGPEYGDERLVVTPSAVPERVLSDEERYREHFEGRIRAVNDSIADAAERRRRANDWTVRDRNGNRWGIDERGVVVGGRHVPTPRPQYGRPARDREDEARRERDQRREIDRQAEDGERDRYLRERQGAIRERADREREERRRQEGGTP